MKHGSRTTLIGLMTLALVGQQPAQAQQVKSFSLSGQWAVDFAEERCTLQGTFSDGSKDLQLIVQSYGDTDQYRATIVNAQLPRNGGVFRDTRYALNPDTQPRGTTMAFRGAVNGKPAISFPLVFGPELPATLTQPSYPPAERQNAMQAWRASLPDYQRQLRELTLFVSAGRQVRLNTGPLSPVLDVMRSCVRDLQQRWGLDPATEDQLSQRAHPDDETWQRIRDSYPFGGHENAFAPVRFMVGADGIATACVVQLPGLPEEFIAAICSRKPARFQPARDAAGQPIASIYRTDIVFQYSD